MQWCCPGFEADQAYKEDQRKAIYLSSLKNNQGQTTDAYNYMKVNPNKNSNSLKTLPVQSFINPPQNPVFLKSYQSAKSRNDTLSKNIEYKKVILWKKTNNLVDRSQALKQAYFVKGNQLKILTQQIDQYFG